jgi:hypothetical protein
MKKEFPPSHELKKAFSANKIIPAKYEAVILKALSCYPELKKIPIEFRLREAHPVPYGTTPVLTNVLMPHSKRKYIVSLLENASPPTEQALFKNLPEEAQLGVLGHELGHVLQFTELGVPSMIKRALGTNSSSEVRRLEREADISAIEHGLGFELYTHARYIRAIPGYVEHRKDLDINYLHPHEILESLPAEQHNEIRNAHP